MDAYESHYYKINRFFLSVVGLWPYLDVKTKQIRASFITSILVFILIVQIMKPLTSNLNGNLFVEILSNFILCICIFAVYITAYIHEKKIGKMIDHIRIDWTKIESKKELEIFTKYAKETSTYSFIFLLVFYVSLYSILLFMLLPVLLDIIVPLNESRYYDILFPVELFFDTNKYFYISFPIVFFALNIMGCASIAIFTLLLLFLQHCNGLFNLVGYIFETAFDGNEEVSTAADEERRIYGRLIRGVWFHERTIKFIEMVNSMCETCYLIEIVLIGIAISVDILRVLEVSLTTENAKEIITCIIHIEANLFWVFINCYFSQKVIDHSSDVHTKICNSKWYISSPKVQKLTLMTIVRSMKPCHVSIGKVFSSSLEFYLTIMQTSVSYAMIFYSLRQ